MATGRTSQLWVSPMIRQRNLQDERTPAGNGKDDSCRWKKNQSIYPADGRKINQYILCLVVGKSVKRHVFDPEGGAAKKRAPTNPKNYETQLKCNDTWMQRKALIYTYIIYTYNQTPPHRGARGACQGNQAPPPTGAGAGSMGACHQP